MSGLLWDEIIKPLGFLSSSNLREPQEMCDFPYIDCISFSSLANALPCPAFVADISGFLLTPTSVFKLSLAKYEAPPENVQAVLDVKSCTDNISKSRRKALTQILILKGDSQHVDCWIEVTSFHHKCPQGPNFQYPGDVPSG
uniref:Uncharacterized protein n=1 Tax=Lynx canadensis TaxID=61383 RepID=A0A667IA57_LYNCA